MSVEARPDPFNFPMPNRADGMSMSTITNKADRVNTHTRKFATARIASENLSNKDIEGKCQN